MSAPQNGSLAVYWNDPAILAAAGTNPEAVFRLLDAHQQTETDATGLPTPTPDAIYQWKSRNKIPDYWRPRLVYALLAAQKIDTTRLFRVGRAPRTRTTT